MNAGLFVTSLVACVQTVALMLLYGLGSDWYRSVTGWVLMGSFTTKAVMFGMIMLGRLFGPLGLVPWVIAMCVFDLVQAGWLFLVIREQRDRRHRTADQREP